MVHTCHVTSTLVCDWLQLHHVMLQPGEMVWYESARLVHGRVEKLNGSAFENIFVHFMPK